MKDGYVRIASAALIPPLVLVLILFVPGRLMPHIGLPASTALILSIYFLFWLPAGVFAGIVGGVRSAVPLGLAMVAADRLLMPDGPWLFSAGLGLLSVGTALAAGRIRDKALAARPHS